MGRELHWVDGPWPDKLAIGPRTRGCDWLAEVADWGRAGIGEVVSLLTPDEEESLDLKHEAATVMHQGMSFISFPIPDRQLPGSRAALANTLERINADLSSGKNVLIHCRQGIGRTGPVAACLFVAKGWNPSAAVEHLSSARGIPIPETTEQRSWVDHYAAILAGAK